MSNIRINGINVEFITFSDGSENCKIPLHLECIKYVSCEVEDCCVSQAAMEHTK